MVVPKRRTSKMRNNVVRISKFQYQVSTECPNCGEYKSSHRVCKNCGSYNGEEVAAK
ncbi:50S ribosomal protein L32 [Staphylococcus aureus]